MGGLLLSDKLTQKLLIEVLADMVRFELENRGDTELVNKSRSYAQDDTVSLEEPSTKAISSASNATFRSGLWLIPRYEVLLANVEG